MTYQEALDYLYSFLDSEARLPRRPLEFNLPRTFALLELVGNPQHTFPSIVIAGTKGKGSTAVMIEAIWRSAGYRTGLWTSPHLHSYRERIQVDRVPISQPDLVGQVETLKPLLDRFDQEQYGLPSVFEIGFVLALTYFARQRVQLAVLEVGLGGRYDTANAVTPLLSVITSISYDHMQTLGTTLGEIAYQKAGIAKPGVPLLTRRQPAEAQAVIAQVAHEVGAPLHLAAEETAALGTTQLALHGAFQRENALLAVAAAGLLANQFDIKSDTIRRGLETAHWPGRFETVSGAPTFILDGAHNGDSAGRLVEALAEQVADRPVVLVFGTTRDKDSSAMFAHLLPAVCAVVLTHSLHPRAETDLARLAAQIAHLQPNLPVEQASDVQAAMDRARMLAPPEGVVCVTGSLFVVAAAREILDLPRVRDE